MSRTFNLGRAPHDADVKLYAKPEVTFDPGFTTLVGCNGSGKSTLLKCLRTELIKTNTPVLMYDNCADGGSMARAASVSNMFDFAALAFSSEGEQMHHNLATFARNLGQFVTCNSDSSELWILLDAVDSGFSIDYIQELKDFLRAVIGASPEKDIYIIASANTYELCIDTQSFSVQSSKYIKSFRSYTQYRNYVLKSAERRNRRG